MGVHHSIKFLEFVRETWSKYENSPRQTMLDRDLKVPKDLSYIIIEGQLYEFGKRRVIWFEMLGKGYNPDRFYVSEMFDLSGHRFQLHLDRSRGDLHDHVVLVDMKDLDAQKHGCKPLSGTGLLTRD